MKCFYPPLLCFVSACLSAGSAAAIAVEEDPVVYAVGAVEGNKGVYKLPLEGPFPETPEKISTTAIGGIQWSFRDSGGTFLSKDKAVGSAYVWSSVYVAVATAEGAGNGPWSETYYKSEWFFASNLRATDMVYDPIDDKVYSWCYVNDWGSYALATFDADAKTATQIGPSDYMKMDALTIDGEGTLYGISGSYGAIYTIDKTTGAYTQKFSLGVSADGNNQSAAYDAATGKIYWGATTMYSASLYAIDLEAQTCEKVYDFPMGQRFNGFYIPAPSTKSGAPAAPADLAATYTGNGNDVQVTFTAPEQTYGGNPLTGELQYVVTVDGDNADEGTIQAGAAYSKTLTMTEGLHTVVAYLSNSVGDGDKAVTKAFSGYDQPAAVTDLALAVEGNTVNLSWTAPVGKNGGMPDMSKLTYKVTRNPGAVEVATGLTENQAADEIPDGLISEYSYTVTVVYDGADAESTASAGVMVGKPYSVPYTQNFDDAESLAAVAFKTLADRNTNTVWELADIDGNKCARLAYEYMSGMAAHLFTAPIQFYAGATYTIKFKVACSSAGETPQLRVNLSKSQSLTSADYIYPWIAARIDYVSTADNVGQFQEQTYEFSVAESGVYSVDFYDTTNSWAYGNAISIDDIEITGVFPTPAMVSDLTAAPVETGSRDIKINFTLPTQDVNGNDLASLTKVVIVRGDETVAEIDKMPGTEDPLTLGAQVEYLVENAPRGFQSYSVVAYNGDFASARATTSTMSGMLNNLVLKDVTFPDEIKIDGTGTVSVNVFNDGGDIALDYRIVLYADGQEEQSLPGELIHTDETLPYEFTIEWFESRPETMKYSVEIEFFGDEAPEDNKSDEYVVKFEPKPNSINDVEAAGVSVTADGGILTVSGAAGMTVGVYTVDGRCVAAETKVPAVWRKALAAGTYVVTIGSNSLKVAVL